MLAPAVGCGTGSGARTAATPPEAAPPTISSTVIPARRSAPPISFTIAKLDLSVELERLVLDDRSARSYRDNVMVYAVAA